MALPVAAMLFAACSHGKAVTAVERTRLLMDSTYDAPLEAVVADFMSPYERMVDSIMSPVVGRTAFALKADRPESPLSNLLADILMWAAESYEERPQLAVYNMGGIRASLPAGDVTYGDVLEVAPFENKICFLTLSGESLMQLFAEMAAVGGESVSRGVELVITLEGELVSARLDGHDIDKAADYRIATIDYLAEGNDKMEAFKQKRDLNAPAGKENDTRFIIADYFRNAADRGEAVAARVEGRVRIER